MQSQKAVSAYFTSKQILPFGFVQQHRQARRSPNAGSMMASVTDGGPAFTRHWMSVTCLGLLHFHIYFGGSSCNWLLRWLFHVFYTPFTQIGLLSYIYALISAYRLHSLHINLTLDLLPLISSGVCQTLSYRYMFYYMR